MLLCSSANSHWQECHLDRHRGCYIYARVCVGAEAAENTVAQHSLIVWLHNKSNVSGGDYLYKERVKQINHQFSQLCIFIYLFFTCMLLAHDFCICAFCLCFGITIRRDLWVCFARVTLKVVKKSDFRSIFALSLSLVCPVPDCRVRGRRKENKWTQISHWGLFNTKIFYL